MKTKDNAVHPCSAYHVYGIPFNDSPESNRFKPEDKNYRAAVFMHLQSLQPSSNGSGPIFSEDVWRFKTTIGKVDYVDKIHFSGVPEDARDLVKHFANYEIEKGLKPSSISVHVGMISVVLRRASEAKHKSFRTITTDDIINAITSTSSRVSYLSHSFHIVETFYRYLIGLCNFNLPIDFKRLDETYENASSLCKAQRSDHRWPLIPLDYDMAIFEKAKDVLYDDKAPFNRRVTAGAVIVLRRLGLRISDLLSMKIDALHPVVVNGIEKPIMVIDYIIRKSMKVNCPLPLHQAYSDRECTAAFKKLLELRNLVPGHENSDYLLLYDLQWMHDGQKHPYFKYKTYKVLIYNMFCEFMLRELPEQALSPHEGISGVKYPSNNHGRPVEDMKQRYTLYIPVFHQFRVNLCTELIAKGVTKLEVERHFWHLRGYFNEVYGWSGPDYYNRPADTRSERIEAAETVLREMYAKGNMPIGVRGGELKRGIENVANLKGLDLAKMLDNDNVKDNIAAIVKGLSNDVAIRSKACGYCIKTGFLSCADDPEADGIRCAYGLCPNMYTFYWFLPLSWNRFKACTSAYAANLSRGLHNPSVKELNCAQDICRRFLQPQMRQLKENVDRFGIDEILNKHLEVKEFIDNYNIINSEIESWMKKSLPMKMSE